MNEAIILNDEDWLAFCLALDEPAQPNEALRQFIAGRSPWEK